MSKQSSFIKVCLLLAGAVPWAHAACVGSPALEAQHRAHPTADTYASLGNWFGEHQQYKCAVDAFHEALKLEPGSAEFSYLLGLTLYSSGDAVNAIDALQKSIELRPEVLRPHLILVAALETVQQGGAARKEWAAALQIDSRSTVALDGLSNSLLSTG